MLFILYSTAFTAYFFFKRQSCNYSKLDLPPWFGLLAFQLTLGMSISSKITYNRVHVIQEGKFSVIYDKVGVSHFVKQNKTYTII